MRLRGVVRAPQRLEYEQLHEGSLQQKLHRSKASAPPHYIDYDPSLPPAAFPTLDQPRVPQKVNGQVSGNGTTVQANDDEKRAPQDRGGRIHNGAGKTNKIMEIDLSDIPNNLVENYIASNGDLNPIYVRNMDVMAKAGQDTSLAYGDMEDSESDCAIVASPKNEATKEATPILDPGWDDLSPSLQVEIIDNLLQVYSWPIILHMLALSTKQREEVQKYVALRNKQIDLEDTKLGQMREKQLNSLLDIDNSSWKHHGTPHKLVFRRTSRRHNRNIRRAMRNDFFSCHLGELVNAKRFLDNRGIDKSYAGEWSNGMVERRSTAKRNNTVSELEPSSVNASAPTNDSTIGAAFDSSPSLSPSKRRSYHTTGGIYPGRPKDIFMRQGDPSLSGQSSVSLRDSSRGAHGNRFTHMNNGTQRAALLQNSEFSCIEPLKLVKTLPPIIRWLSEPPRLPLKPRMVQRKSDAVVSRRPVPTLSASAKLKQRLQRVRPEAQQNRSKGGLENSTRESTIDKDWSSAFCLPKARPSFFDGQGYSRPTSASPSRALLEGDNRTSGLFQRGNPGNVSTTPDFEKFITIPDSDQEVRASSDNESEDSCSSSLLPSSMGFSDHVQSMSSFVASTLERDGGCNHHGEESNQEDEMVLVPTGSANPIKRRDHLVRHSSARGH